MSERALVLSAVGVMLSEVDYRRPAAIGRWECRGEETLRARLPAGLALAALDPTSRVDFLLVTTKATEPIEGPPSEGYLSALQVATKDLEAVARRQNHTGEVHFGSLRADWEEAPDIVDYLAGMPARVEDAVARAFFSEADGGRVFEQYQRIFVDVSAGLRPIALGLLLATAYLKEARGLSERVATLYGELVQASAPAWFEQDGAAVARPRPAAAASGRGFDTTPFFDSMAAATAVTHLARGLDLRSAEGFIQRISPSAQLPAPLHQFIRSAQLALDMEAARAAADPRLAPALPASSGRGTLVSSLLADIVSATADWRVHSVPVKKGDWVLDDADLDRHARVVDLLLRHGRSADALLHVREYCVSALQLADAKRRGAETDSWLRERRSRGERLLGALSYFSAPRDQALQNVLRARGATDDDIAVAQKLKRLTQLRNDLAHAARKPTWTEADYAREIEDLWSVLRFHLEWAGCLAAQALPTGLGVLAMALPFTRRAGALAHALHAARTRLGDGFCLLLFASREALRATRRDGTSWLQAACKAGDLDLPARWVEVAWKDAQRLTCAWSASGGVAPSSDDVRDASFLLVPMDDGSQPPAPKREGRPARDASTLVGSLFRALAPRLGNAESIAVCDAGATSYQALVLREVARQAAEQQSLVEHWIVSRRGGTPDDEAQAFAADGVQVAIDGVGSWALADVPARR